MKEFKRSTNGFSYTFEYNLAPYEKVIVKIPPITPNKRGVNDIGWVSNGTVALYGTLSDKPDSEDALWQQILERDEINKTVSALKAENGQTSCKIIIRIILN